LAGRSARDGGADFRVDLSERRAVVTGAANGIGLAIASVLSRCGARVVLADLDEAAGSLAARDLDQAVFVRADVSSIAECRALVHSAEQALGGIDILVNNAGVQHVSAIEEFPEERWEAMLGLMLTGPFVLMKYALTGMYARGWGRVVNIASVHGLVASPFKSAYVAAKHGLIGLTKTAALEAGEKGVTVNAICPAYVRTALVERQLTDQARTHGISEDQVITQIMLAPAAIKRLLEPAEVAAYVLFLCSESGAGITGAAQLIDCGWTAE
jgi:3-hydroxybutyrate dehydrogenase